MRLCNVDIVIDRGGSYSDNVNQEPRDDVTNCRTAKFAHANFRRKSGCGGARWGWIRDTWEPHLTDEPSAELISSSIIKFR